MSLLGKYDPASVIRLSRPGRCIRGHVTAAAAAKFREALEIGKVALGEDAWVCRRAREYLEGV